MTNRHAFRWMSLALLMSGAAVLPGAAETPVASGKARILARPHVSESIRPVNPQELAALLVMFIPWNDPTPTPAVPTGNGDGNGQNNGGGGNGQNNGGGGGNGQGSGGGGNGQGSGGSTDPGGGKTGEPGGTTGLGGGETHDNPEPATVVTTLLGVGLLGLAGLRRRRWSLG